MNGNSFDFMGVIQTASIFALVFCVWLICVLLWSMRRSAREEKVQRRLGIGGHKNEGKDRILRLWHDGEENTTRVATVEIKRSRLSKMRKTYEEARMSLPFHSFVLAVVGLTLLAFVLIYGVTGNPIFGLGGAALVVSGGIAIIGRRVNQQAELFETQLVDALDVATRSLRAGHPLGSAFQLISTELKPPVSEVFAEFCQQQALGVSMEDALRRSASRSRSVDLRLFVTATIIQMRTGGNLADMMDRLSAVIRNRIRLHRRVKVLTSQAQLSKRILIAMPFVTFFCLLALNPDYMEPFYTTYPGKVMIVVASISLFVGSWIMNRIADLKY